MNKLALRVLFCVGFLAAGIFVVQNEAHAATKIKTVEHFFFQYESTTNISANNGIKNTAWPATCDGSNNASTSIPFPESGATVKSAWIEWRTIIEGATTAAGDMRFCREGQAASSISLGSINTDTGESQQIILRMDVTSDIATTTATYFFNARVDNTIRNTDSVKLIITYEYDDTSATQLKTTKYSAGCRASQASAGTIDTFEINPNITESSVTIESTWVEYYGQTPGSVTTDLQLLVALNDATSSVVAVDNVNRTSMDFLMLANTTTTVNLSATNTINLVNNSAAANVKCAEWVITFSYNHSAANNQSWTTRYFLGQSSGFLSAAATTTIGSHAINLPETSITFRSVWMRYVFDMSKADVVDVTVSIGGTATTSSLGYDVNVGAGGGRNSGKAHILFDITSFFTTNWTNGATTTARMHTLTASSIEAVSAELIITYTFAKSSDTAVKSVVWFVGQDTTKNSAGSGFTGSFTPNIPETVSITRRNSAVLGDFIMGSSGTTETTTMDDTVAGGTDTQGITIEANGESATYQTILKTTSQWTNATTASQTINFTYNVTGAQHTEGGTGYLTYEYEFAANVAPTVSNVSLNASSTIILIENTTTSVLVTGTLTDTNGGADISNATATVYRSGVASNCAADDNNCYRLATSSCTLGAVSGNNRPATCTAAIWFHADATDAGTFSAQIWSAELTAIDAADAKGSATNTPELIEINTLLALDVTVIITYGTLSLGATSSASQIVAVTTTGNVALDVELQATSSDSGGSGGMTLSDFSDNIPPAKQQFATSSKEYRDAGDPADAEIFDLASTTVVFLELESVKPTTHAGDTSDEFDNTFWRIGIPASQTLGDYNGTTTATALQD